MLIRTILVPFSGEEEDHASLACALEIAKQFNAHVQCLFVSPDIISYIYPDIGIPNPALGGYIEEFEKASEKRLNSAKTLFTSLTNQHNITVEERLTATPQASAYFQAGKGDMQHHITLQGRLSDLIVMQGSFTSGNSPYKPWAVTSLFETGKPVLITPAATPKPIGKCIAIAWNGSVESARTLHYALPFLQKAEQIHIITVNNEGETPFPLETVTLYLALHGINAKTHNVHTKARPTGMVLVEEARKTGADLLVMGAFTHPRLRQMIMGGATDYMLEHTGLPVLMAH